LDLLLELVLLYGLSELNLLLLLDLLLLVYLLLLVGHHLAVSCGLEVLLDGLKDVVELLVLGGSYCLLGPCFLLGVELRLWARSLDVVKCLLGALLRVDRAGLV